MTLITVLIIENIVFRKYTQRYLGVKEHHASNLLSYNEDFIAILLIPKYKKKKDLKWGVGDTNHLKMSNSTRLVNKLMARP